MGSGLWISNLFQQLNRILQTPDVVFPFYSADSHFEIMTSVEDRIQSLVETHLGISDRTKLDVRTSELGVNSLEAVAFLKTVNREFGVSIPPSVASGFSTLRAMIEYLETQ